MSLDSSLISNIASWMLAADSISERHQASDLHVGKCSDLNSTVCHAIEVLDWASAFATRRSLHVVPACAISLAPIELIDRHGEWNRFSESMFDEFQNTSLYVFRSACEMRSLITDGDDPRQLVGCHLVQGNYGYVALLHDERMNWLNRILWLVGQTITLNPASDLSADQTPPTKERD
jgi:hypothetical protein